MPSYNVKADGQWRPAKEVHVKVNGTWKKAKEVWVKAEGQWRRVMSTALDFEIDLGDSYNNFQGQQSFSGQEFIARTTGGVGPFAYTWTFTKIYNRANAVSSPNARSFTLETSGNSLQLGGNYDEGEVTCTVRDTSSGQQISKSTYYALGSGM